MDHLYELTADYMRLLDAIEAGEIPEEAIEDTLAGIEGEIDEKIDAIACMVKELIGEAESISEEERSLAERRRAKERKAARLKDYIRAQMALTNRKKIETARNVVRLGATTQRVEITDLDALKGYKEAWKPYTYKVTDVDKVALKTLLQNGEQIPGAKLSEGQRTLTIK